MKNLITLLFLLVYLPLKAEDISLKITSGFDPQESVVIKKILEEGFKRAKAGLVYKALPNQRSLLNANSGISDGEAARIWDINKIYPNLIRVPVSTYSIDIAVMSRNKIHFDNVSDLKKYNIGVIRGMKIAEKMISGIKPKSYIQATNTKALVKMLSNNRIDIAVTNRMALLSTLGETKGKKFFINEKPLLRLPLYMHLNKKHHKFIPQFEAAFQSMHDDGTYKKIMKSFIDNMIDKTEDSVEVIADD